MNIFRKFKKRGREFWGLEKAFTKMSKQNNMMRMIHFDHTAMNFIYNQVLFTWMAIP